MQPADRSILLMVGKVELGQGILTALAQLCADELDVNIERIRIVSGDTAVVPNEGTTAGSFSMPDSGNAVRHAAAEARAALLELASKRLAVSMESLRVDDAVVIADTGARTTYWDLPAGEELRREATGKVPPKRSGHRYIGRSIPRLDLTPKILGQSMFVHELRPEGLLFGRVVRPSTYRARLLAADTAAVERMPGVVKVVRDGSFLGVVAQRESQVNAAAEALARNCRWETPSALPRTEGVEAWLRSAPIILPWMEAALRPATLRPRPTLHWFRPSPWEIRWVGCLRPPTIGAPTVTQAASPLASTCPQRAQARVFRSPSSFSTERWIPSLTPTVAMPRA